MEGINIEKKSLDKIAIVISASSDIGTALSLRWLERKWQLYGTYRTYSPNVEAIQKNGGVMVFCDISEQRAVDEASENLIKGCLNWDILILASGDQEPISPFEESNFSYWEQSIRKNFLAQMQFVHNLLPYRNRKHSTPSVLFFAGGGTNSSTLNYSAYTVSKIALIKMCELLDAEISDTRFIIIGPGWVKTKIHDATIKAGNHAGKNYRRTIQKLSSDECTPMEEILDCCDWIVDTPREVVGGRNFSVVFDRWGSIELSEMLIKNPDMYKLRRNGNDLLVKNDGGK